AAEPSHVSGTSQVPVAGRHTVPERVLASAGQAGLVPVQVSATSQVPADARQTLPVATKTSDGQLVLTPSHASATSQTPTARRQSTPEFPARYWQPLTESQLSSVHGLSSRHWSAVPAIVRHFDTPSVSRKHPSIPLQISSSLQKDPSSTFGCVHSPRSQTSMVHGLWSSKHAALLLA